MKREWIDMESLLTVWAHPGWLGALSVLPSKSVLYGAFV